MKCRVFYQGIVNHCYQRSADHCVLFYSYRDHLVYFTHYCVMARKYGVKVLSLCQMPDHVHDTVVAEYKEDLSAFKRETNKLFSHKRNAYFHLSSPTLEHPYGSAPKFGTKKVRTNLIYVGNNPVERKLTRKAEEYRWNYLAYASSEHPFSNKLIVRYSRWPLQKAVKEIKAMARNGRPLNYSILERLFRPLDSGERQQLTDYIISAYNVIDYKAAQSYFGSLENMMTAIHASAGSEFEIRETFLGKSDLYYGQMAQWLLRRGYIQEIHEILSLEEDRKHDLFLKLQRAFDCPLEQIGSFLHMPLKRRRMDNAG